MGNTLFRFIGCVALLAGVTAAYAQTDAAGTTSTAPHSKLGRALAKVDLGLSGIATFSGSTSGTSASGPNGPQTFTQTASNGAGLLVTLHGQKSPWVGAEFNYSLSKNSNRYTCCNYSPTTGQPLTAPFEVQATMHEYTLGYAIRPVTTLAGLHPYAAVGVGTMEFSPTKYGGQNLPKQARMTYYGTVGVEAALSPSFGFRAGIRELSFLAPDFGQNYLTIRKRVLTTEPQIGVYLHF